MKPGSSVFPETFTIFAFLGTVTASAGPTALILLFVITTVPLSITSSLFMVMIFMLQVDFPMGHVIGKMDKKLI